MEMHIVGNGQNIVAIVAIRYKKMIQELIAVKVMNVILKDMADTIVMLLGKNGNQMEMHIVGNGKIFGVILDMVSGVHQKVVGNVV